MFKVWILNLIRFLSSNHGKEKLEILFFIKGVTATGDYYYCDEFLLVLSVSLVEFFYFYLFIFHNVSKNLYHIAKVGKDLDLAYANLVSKHTNLHQISRRASSNPIKVIE